MTQQSTSANDKHLINTYVSDMVALFQHINKPLEAQLKAPEPSNYTEAITTIEQIKRVTTAHQELLEAHLKSLGGSADHGVKSAWAQILGVGAAAVAGVRSTKVSKGLRDDYTALGLAAISYTMLEATALGLGDRATAQLAKRGLDDIAPLIITISRVMPTVVLQELKDDGENVQISAAQLAEQSTAQSWGKSSN